MGHSPQVATLPLTSRTPPSTYTWSDTGLTPGTYYEYHIIAFNVSGNNDFAGVNATTLTDPPSTLPRPTGQRSRNLSWAAPAGAVTYNVYRGTSPGGENGTPIATGLTGTGYEDAAVTVGTAYYYTVTPSTRMPARRCPPRAILPRRGLRHADATAAAPTSVTAVSAENTFSAK